MWPRTYPKLVLLLMLLLVNQRAPQTYNAGFKLASLAPSTRAPLMNPLQSPTLTQNQATQELTLSPLKPLLVLPPES